MGNCVSTPDLKLETTCGVEIIPGRCKCDEPAPVTFTYYEAWRVGYNQRRVTNPPGAPPTRYDDTASFQNPWNSCGKYLQNGELRFYSDSDTPDLSLKWPADGREFGTHTKCKTSAKMLYAFDGKDGPPDFWKDVNRVPLAVGRRSFEMNWRCCGCDPRSKRKSVARSDP